MPVPDRGALPFDRVTVGDTFSVSRTITDAEIALFATLSGDLNPLHLSDTAARASRYGKRIATGQHTIAIMMGAVANHFSGYGKFVGLEFSARLHAAVGAGDTLEVDWRVAETIPKPQAAGGLVVLEGTGRSQDGTLLITATGKVLLSETL
ncbi:MAG: MaoC family dehydratase [Chloroflexi bacterium]|nr:MaoC family dehydratase [Chloroflexota bacterium]